MEEVDKRLWISLGLKKCGVLMKPYGYLITAQSISAEVLSTTLWLRLLSEATNFTPFNTLARPKPSAVIKEHPRTPRLELLILVFTHDHQASSMNQSRAPHTRPKASHSIPSWGHRRAERLPPQPPNSRFCEARHCASRYTARLPSTGRLLVYDTWNHIFAGAKKLPPRPLFLRSTLRMDVRLTCYRVPIGRVS